jgi:ribosomal protein S18 acetylase RimI-like enzyme
VPDPLDRLVTIRRATPDDAAAVATVMSSVVAERVHSAVDVAWTAEEERRFLAAMTPREAVHLAVDPTEGVVALQILERWSPVLDSMAHAAQVGTFVLAPWRGRGLGRRLFEATLAFAAASGYRKVVIQVRGSNLAAQHFYQAIGFAVCGRLTRQVVVDGVEDDEVLMERRVRT